ncbi:uncharacterized protein EV154DRAFT_483488 [Mucor mucedo]|uniref:uncharacterized protein n=1 Tax=Mucor mucedo TaxID=29922 RepID=UPI00221F1E2C|nr:uncharacterized protein EV154DRAFT_483488 [Mucor mucedo]KAI7889073.1 hypothetical protein EV154DRAFT_483488 [Mucor mucedo]
MTRVVEKDGGFVDGSEESLGTIIKNAAIRKHPIYHPLDTNERSIVCLGLNSIIDLSAQYPERQTTLFNKKQWEDISNECPLYTLNDTLYRGVDEAANYVFNLYNSKKHSQLESNHTYLQCNPAIYSVNAPLVFTVQSTTRNWNFMYQQVITLKGQFNAELNDSFRDIDFCLYFYESLLMLQKHHGYLFTEDIDTSEWDMIVKFWGPVMERLFTGTGLRLKWGDTILTINDVTAMASVIF